MNNIEEIIKDMQEQVENAKYSNPKDSFSWDREQINILIEDAEQIIQALQSTTVRLKYPENKPKANKQYLVFKQGKPYPLIRKTDEMGFFKFRMEHLDGFIEIPEER